jgi:secreted trypsin-like serine protease
MISLNSFYFAINKCSSAFAQSFCRALKLVRKMQTIALVLLFFVVLANAVPTPKDIAISPFIVNGTSAKIEEFPFMASLQWEYNATAWLHYCGGTILNDFYVLTAAHCVYGDKPEGNRVEYGRTVIMNDLGASGGGIVFFEKIIWHEKYNKDSYINDIALIRTKTAMSSDLFENRVKLVMPSDFFFTGTPATLSGICNQLFNFMRLVDLKIAIFEYKI